MTLTLHVPTDPADTVTYLPLTSLYLSPLNARQDVDDAEIDAMADSISYCGLLQNLIGLQGDDGRVEIVAGGKRLRALQRLAREGFIGRQGLAMHRIPVKLATTTAEALEWAGAENAARTQPHPADEVRAYRAMAKRDFPARQIALAFAQTEAHVKRRLALAGLPDPVLDALRADQLTLDQAAAFTLAGTEAEALAILANLLAPGANRWHFEPRSLRHMLTQNRPGAGDRRLKFIGLDAYTAAGGTLTLDLFQDHSYVNDPTLLETLAAGALQAAGADLQQTEGWSWLEVVGDYNDLWGKYDQIAPTEGELTEADAATYDRLCELAEADALYAEGQAQLDVLQARLDGDWTDDDRARAGIAVWIQHGGEIGVRRGLLRRGGTTADNDASDSDDDDTAPRPTPAAEAGLPQNLRDDLRAIRLLALQNALLTDGGLLFDLLQWQITGGDMVPWQMPLAVQLTHSPNTPDVADGLTLPARLAQPGPALDRFEPTPQAFAAFVARPERDRMQAMFAAIARVYHQATGPLSVHLAQRLRPDARAIWTPTAKNYLGRIPAPMLDALWHDLVPADREAEHRNFAGLTKKQKAAELEKLFGSDDYREALGLSRDQTTRIASWLPEDLRWPEAEAEDDQPGEDLDA